MGAMKVPIGLTLGFVLGMLFAGGLHAYELTGMKFDHSEITYDCDPRLQKAVQEWASVSGLEDGGCSETPDIQLVILGSCAAGIHGSAGYTKTNFPGNTILEGTIWMCPSGLELEGVWLHEVGHVLGSSHSGDVYAVMYAWCCNSMSADDRAMIEFLYGPERTTETLTPRIYQSFVPMVAN